MGEETNPGNKDVDAEAEAEASFEQASEEDGATNSTNAEEPIDFDSKRPSILGMTVVEDDAGRPLVVDVGASTPTWDAGIRKDDVIRSLHGVEAKSFQEWADSVRKVVADAKAGQTIPVQILREGSPLDLQVRISEQKGITPPRPVRVQAPNGVQNPTQPAVEQPIQPGVGPYPVGGGGVSVGPVVFDGGDARAAGDQAPIHAAAQLMAVNNRAGTAPAPAALPPQNAANAAGQAENPNGTAPGTFPGNPTNATGAAPGTSGVAPGTFPNNSTGTAGTDNAASGQVGVAEFADNASGMLAVVTLGGLPPGNYRVGIGEFNGNDIAEPNMPASRRDGIRSQRFRDRFPTPGAPPSGVQPQPPVVPYQRSPQVDPANGRSQPGVPSGSGQPAPSTPGAGGSPGTSGGGAGKTLSDAGSEQSRFYVLAQVTPAATNQQQINTGNTGIALPSTNPPEQVGDPSQSRRLPLESGRRVPATQPGLAQNRNTSPGTGGQFGIDLGVVTVRPNGGGKLQQRLEGLRVASVVGQSVLVVPVDAPIAGNARGAAGSLGVVATGVIQLISADQPRSQITNGSPNAQVPGTSQGSAETQRVPANAGANQPVPAQTPSVPADRNQR